MSVNLDDELGASLGLPSSSSSSVSIPSLPDHPLDSFEIFTNMTSSLEEIKDQEAAIAIADREEDTNVENSNNVETFEDPSSNAGTGEDDDCVHSGEWTSKSKHIFVLSSAGKPIYSRYGNEDQLAWLFGVMQTLVSFVQAADDTIKSIHAGNMSFVFLVKNHLILVAVSQTQESTGQLLSQLNYVFNEIASALTVTRLNKIYEHRQNFDLRRLLAGIERLIDSLLVFSEEDPAFTLGAVQCLPLSPSVRESISSAIVGACSKIKNVVFGILLARNQLITLVRMKKYPLHQADLHLIFNLVGGSESIKAAEFWTPLCLPRFDASGFLYGHISYLSEDCEACLLLLTVDSHVFFTLSEAKQKIVERLRRGNCLEAINESLGAAPETCALAGFPELRHYLYKCKSTAQFCQPGVGPPYTVCPGSLRDLYQRAHQVLHCPARPLKLMFEKNPNEALLAWDTQGFELYVVFEPLIDTGSAINCVSRLLNWIKKREDKLFQLTVPNF